MRLRRLSDTGVEYFGEFLDSLGADPSLSLPAELLDDRVMTDQVVPEVEVEERAFPDRMGLAAYLYRDTALDEVPDVTWDRGIWSWLTVFYFDQLCPPDDEGQRAPRQRARLLPALGDWRTYYRHLLVGPYRLYRAHHERPECLRAVLANPVHQPGELYEQIASRMKLATNPAVMETTVRLYWDSASGELKVGARGTRGPGIARRLADVLYQFDLTWDLFVMDADDLLDLLPQEFDRFRDE